MAKIFVKYVPILNSDHEMQAPCDACVRFHEDFTSQLKIGAENKVRKQKSSDSL